MNIYDFSVKDIQGQDISLNCFKEKVLLIVNTATGCGFTPQYTGLQKLYDDYQAKGFEILDFPCNQFGHQAPGTEDEINTFCTLNYHTTFPRFAKIEINGKNEHPLYKYLKSQQKGLLTAEIKWNFTKFLVDRKGNIMRRFAPTEKPEKLVNEIEKLLENSHSPSMANG
ncbi:MAG: glutathione peroxidase [Spirochaetaceae bacterium]|jgi:glutathione peroxidase|nr:glutathione peroxidase [Spirochaetaceae bacterium]